MRSLDRWVVDASVAAKWYLRDEDLIAEADRVFDTVVTAGSTAPHIIRHEFANAQSSAFRSGRISGETAERNLAHFLRSSLGTEPDPASVIQRAAEITMDLSIYINDAIYIALAERLGCEFVTDDGTLLRAIAGRRPDVRWLGDVPLA